MKKNSRSSSKSRTAKNLRQLKRKLSRRQKASAEFQYEALEPKLPLDASFAFNADGESLFFNNFTPAESVFININNDGDLVASLQNGTWQGGFGDEDDGAVAGGVLTVEGDFDEFSIQGLADGSVVTFGNNSDFGGVDLDISSTTDFFVVRDPGGNQSGFDVNELTITGGTTQIFDPRSEIGEINLNQVISFEYSTDNNINAGSLNTIDGGEVVLDTDGNIVFDSVNIPGTLVALADGNVTRQNQNNILAANTFLFDVGGNVDIQHLRVTEIAGDVDGNFTITDSNAVLSNVDTTIISPEFISVSGIPFFFGGLTVDGDLDWEIRFSSLTQEVDAPVLLSLGDRIPDSPFLDTDADAGTAIFRLVTFDQTESILLAESDFNDFGSIDVIYQNPPSFVTDTQVPRIAYFNAIEFSDRDSIQVGNINTNFIPTDIDQDATDTFESRVRISAGRGLVAGEDFPVLVGNQIGNITITGQIESENLLLQAPGIFDASGADIDTHHLFLGGDAEIEGRANFQIVADSLQELSVNVFDSFDVVTQQELRIVAGEYLGIGGNDPLVIDPANDLGNVATGAVVDINTIGSNFDTELALFDINGTLIGQNDDAFGLQSQILNAGLADGTYFIAVGGFSASFGNGFNANGGFSSGDFTLNVNGISTNGALAANEVVFFSFNVGAGATQAPGIVETFNPEVFTTSGASEFARIESTRLDFDTSFTAGKLVADVATDIEQADGAVVTIDELQIEAKRTVLDNPANDFQRIAVLGDGFADLFTDGISNNDEDVLVIRDVGTLEIASLDNQPVDAVTTFFPNTSVANTINGISIDGTVDIITGFGGEVSIPRTGGPTAEQIGPTGQIERFTTVPGRTDIVFRDDNYDGSVRPAYFIEFIYDGTSELSIRSDPFERRDPERVRNELDIELALYNEAGDLLAVDDDDSSNEFDVLNLSDVDPSALFNGNLPAGRYFVAASAFATEFEDGFVVNTSNNLTGTLNVTIANGAAFVAPETGRDLTQQSTAPLIVTGGEDVGDIEDGEPDGSVVLSTLNGGAILLAETDLNDVRELTVNEARGIEFTDADDAVIVSNVTEAYDFARLSVGRAADGGVLTLGDFAADEVLIQADTGVVTNGELDIRRLLIGGPESRDSGGDIAIISPNTEELAFQFVDNVDIDDDGGVTVTFDTDLAFATSQALTIGSFEYRDSGIVLSQSRADEIRIQAQSLAVESTLEAVTKMVIEVDDTLTTVTPDGTPAIMTPQLYFTGASLDLSQSDNPIGQISAALNGDGGFQLQSSITTNVAMLDNQIDVGELPTSDTLNFNPANTLEGVTTGDDIDFNVARLTQDEGSVLRGDVLTIFTTGQRGVEDTTDPGGPVVLPTGPEVDNGTRIDNDVATDIAGSFEVTVGDGNGVFSSQLTYEQLDDSLATGDLVFNYTTYVQVGDTITSLAFTTITQEATLISDDVVESRGSFDGPNGQVNWIAESRFEDGIATFLSSLELEAETGTTLGDIQIISYLDEDIQGVSDDFLTTTGTPGEEDFRAFTLDGPNRVGFSHGGFYTDDGTNQINATYNGWAADQYFELRSAIEGNTQAFSINGTIDLTDLPVLSDPDFFPAFGTNDVATAFAWNTVATETSSTITSFLEFLPTIEAVMGGPEEPEVPFADVVLDQANSISRLIIPSANGVSFTNDRQFVADTINATLDVSLTTQAGDIVVQSIDTPEDVSLTAADDIRDTDAQDGNRIAAATLNLVAGNNIDEDPQFNGILLQTDVDTIEASVNSTDSGDVILRELNDVALGTVVAGDGFIDVVALGTISADDISHTTQNENNTITLIAVGDDSDISLGSLSTGNAANIRLIAGDDVNHLAGAATQLISADDLFILADNLTADDNSGITLNTNVVSGDFQVGRGPDLNPNPGSITIDENNAILLDYAKTRLGTIDVTAGGNLVADFVQSEGINTGDAVTLTATGDGSDVVTNEIRVRLSTGGVAINAADDIRDVDSSDDRLIIASSVALNAGNNVQDNFNGIIAQTRTNLISAQVTSEANASMFIYNRNALRLENTFVTNGNIGITNTGGNLQAADVSSGGQANSRIFLRTLGLGSDISIGRLEAADRGEIFLDSADDIFDSAFADELFIAAEFLSATARNNAIESFDGVILNTDVDSLFISQPNGGEKFIREV